MATDAEILAAISSSRSWHAAGRALGLKSVNGGAMRTLKDRASALGADTSHFTHQRTWSDSQLEAAVCEAESWSDVSRSLGLAESGDTFVRFKSQATRLGLDLSRIEPPVYETPSALRELVPIRSHLSKAAEPLAAAWFAARGVPVALPVQQRAYDLLALFDGRDQRVQVKSTTSRAQHETWRVLIGRRPYVLDKSASREPYDPDELDYFFIIDGDYQIYLIPILVVAGKSAINIGPYAAFKVGDASSLFAGVVEGEMAADG